MSAAALASAAAIGSWGVVEWIGWDRFAEQLSWMLNAHRGLEGRIRHRFRYLTLDPAGVQSFARDYARHYGNVRRFRTPGDDVFGRYLLSTDFFRNGADESRPVRYVLFYDPYVSPCWNPLVPAPGYA